MPPRLNWCHKRKTRRDFSGRVKTKLVFGGKRQSERRDSSDGLIVPPHRTTFSSHSVTSCIGMYPTSNDGFAHADSLLPRIQLGSVSERLREAPTKRRTEAAMPHECTRNTACILPPRLTLRSPIKCPALPRPWMPTN